MPHETPDANAVFEIGVVIRLIERLDAGGFDKDRDMKHAVESIKVLMKNEYGPFISGVGGENVNTTPEYIHVCYRLGVNFGGTYKLVHARNTGQ